MLAADESDVDLDAVMAASDAAIAHAKAAAAGGGSSAAAPPAPPSAAATAAAAASPPPSALSSLDSFLVLSAAAAGSADATGAGGRPTSASGRFDAVTELGLSAEEAAAAAVAYSRCGGLCVRGCVWAGLAERERKDRCVVFTREGSHLRARSSV